MKRTFNTSLVLIICFLTGLTANFSIALSISEADGTLEQREAKRQELIDAYEESYNLWLELNEEHGESYRFTRRYASWVGYGSSTTIYVENGEIVKRTYQEFNLENPDGDYPSWVETGEAIGSHRNGESVSTLEDLYPVCKDILMNTPLEDNDVWFNTNDYGIMAYCGYYPHGCMDDCSEGLSIVEFEFLLDE